MGAVKITVLIDHLRLDPDAEFHPQLFDAGNQCLKAAGELLFVDGPIPQTCIVAVARAEPAIIHDEQLNSQMRSFLSDVHQLVRGEVHLRGLPMVDEYRLAAALPGIVNQVVPDASMELPAHLSKAGRRTNQGRFRSRKAFSGLKRPTELAGTDTHDQARILKLIQLCCRLEIAAVQQHSAIAQTMVLICVSVAQDNKGVMLMAGSSPGAVHALNARVQMGAARTTLHDMSAVKCDHIQIGADKVQAQRSAPAQANHSIPPVDDPDGPSDQIILLQHAIEQFDLYLRGGVGQRDREGIPFFLRAVEGGQTFQCILASAYLAVHIP